jgi:hypothetical protein
MLKTVRILFVSAVVSSLALGQSQVATVSSSSSFTLRGANVNSGQGVPDWPVLAGDTIKAVNSPVVLTFPDGSTITLDPGAEATVSLSGPTPVFRLLKGSAHYSLKSLTSVQVISGNQNVTLTSLTGDLGRSGGHGIWTPAHTAIGIAGAGAAAGLGVGVSQATSGGPSVSPSH